MPGYRPQRKYVAVLAMVGGLILVFGARFRSRQVLETPLNQAEMLRLQLASQRRTLKELTAFYSRVAEEAAPGLVWILGMEQSGVIWDAGGTILSAGPRESLQLSPAARGKRLNREVLSVYTPVAELKATDASGLRPVRLGRAETLLQGSTILHLAANRGGGSLYAPGTFEGVVSVTCGEYRVEAVETTIPFGNSAAGGGIFDLEGNLLALVLRCDDGLEAVRPESVERILARAKTFSERLRRRYGLRLEAMTSELRDYFKTDRGLLVAEVWEGWPADDAGLSPGDVIQAIDNREVRGMDDLRQLLLPIAYPAFDVWVARYGRTRRIRLPARPPNSPRENGGSAGIRLGREPGGYPIEDVVTGSRADQAMIRPGDRLIEIGGKRPRSVARARAVFAAENPAPSYVVVRRGRRRLGAFLR